MSTPPEETHSTECLICPYCGYRHKDSWELGDGGEGCGEMDCGNCEKEFTWSRSFTVHYTGIPSK